MLPVMICLRDAVEERANLVQRLRSYGGRPSRFNTTNDVKAQWQTISFCGAMPMSGPVLMIDATGSELQDGPALSSSSSSATRGRP
jgi:hypothetical protein